MNFHLFLLFLLIFILIFFKGTYLVSAIWHGFYASYYISFIHWGFVSTLARYFYKASLSFPNFNYKNPIYLVVRWVAPNFMLNYYGIAFLNLSFGTVLKFFNNSWWIPNIVLYSLMAFFLITGNFLFLNYLKKSWFLGFGQKSSKKKNGKEEVKKE